MQGGYYREARKVPPARRLRCSAKSQHQKLRGAVQKASTSSTCSKLAVQREKPAPKASGAERKASTSSTCAKLVVQREKPAPEASGAVGKASTSNICAKLAVQCDISFHGRFRLQPTEVVSAACSRTHVQGAVVFDGVVRTERKFRALPIHGRPVCASTKS